MNVKILYTKFTTPLSDIEYQKLLGCLPTCQRERNRRFVRWQDKHSHLFGRLLLKNGLESYGYKKNCLNLIKYNEYNRPYFNSDIDFNISHSGDYVVCAIGKNLRLGVDVEKVNEIEFKDFRGVMTNEQWRDIKEDIYPKRAFFKYWTAKESVIKADSRGLLIPLKDLHLLDNTVSYDNSIWYLNHLNFDIENCACLATNIKNIDISFKKIYF